MVGLGWQGQHRAERAPESAFQRVAASRCLHKTRGRCTLWAMRESQVIIERVRRVSADIQQIDLTAQQPLMQLRPGQSLFARPAIPNGWTPYLREQWIPVDILPGRVVVELPTGASLAPGELANVLSPVGRPIPLRPNIQRLLLIAEDAMPTPFALLARALSSGGVAVTLVLGGRATDYPLELLSPEIEILHSSTDWKWPDQVETLNWADQVIVLAPTLSQAAVYSRLYETISQLRHHDIPDNFVCGLFYPRLACGEGACDSCLVAAQKKDLLACTDGPAIDLKKVNFL